MLQEVADKELAFGLRAKQQSQAEGMEHDPSKGMGRMQCESCAVGKRWDECDQEHIRDNQDELKIRGPA